MEKRFIAILLVAMATFVLTSCTTKHADVVVASYNDSEIKLPVFERAYAKNVGGVEAAKDDSISSMKNFLDLYVTFRMKLKDAMEKGYDKDSSLQDELKTYQQQVGAAYLVEKNLIEPNLKNLYDLRKYEYRVSHIMLRTDRRSEEETEKLADSIYQQILKGESFEQMAEQYSEENVSRAYGGDIYWITAGLIDSPEFEKAAFSLEPGELYPGVVKTKYGYHIIKLTDKQPRVESVRASHILIDFYNGEGNKDEEAAKLTIDSVKALLDGGKDFAEVAKEYSEDYGSAENGGDLNFFQRRQMVRPFDEAVFSLKKDEISDIIETNYGYHIIKLTDVKPIAPYEESREQLLKIYKKAYFPTQRAAFTDSLLEKHRYTLNENVLDMLVENGDTVKFGHVSVDNSWYSDFADSIIFSVGDISFRVDTLINRIDVSGKYRGKNVTRNLLSEAINFFKGDAALMAEAMTLDTYNEDFANLMEDYKNGIYIFKLQEEVIWDQMEIDSVALAKIYEERKEQFVWDFDRIEFREIFSHNDSLINVYYQMLENGEPFDSLAVKYTERHIASGDPGHYGPLNVEASKLSQKANELLSTEGEYSEPFRIGTGWSIVKLIKKDTRRQKTFEEARAELAGIYQDQESKRLEKEYVNSLREKYSPEIEYENLQRAFKPDTEE